MPATTTPAAPAGAQPAAPAASPNAIPTVPAGSPQIPLPANGQTGPQTIQAPGVIPIGELLDPARPKEGAPPVTRQQAADPFAKPKEGEQQPTQEPYNEPTWLDQTWPQDVAFPEGFDRERIPNHGALVHSFIEQTKKITELGQTNSELKKSLKAATEGKGSEAVNALYGKMESAIRENKGFTVDDAEALSGMMGVPASHIQLFGEFLHERTESSIKGVGAMLGVDEKGALEFLAKIKDSPHFTDAQIEAYTHMLYANDLSFIPFVAKKFGMSIAQPQPGQQPAAPAQPQQQPGANPARGVGAFQPQIPTGTPPAPSAPDIYADRNESNRALSIAIQHMQTTGDDSMEKAHRAKLERSIPHWR